jgi:hypothetical protein
VIVDNAWNRDRHESEVSLAKGKATLEGLVDWFLTSSTAAVTQLQQQGAMPPPAVYVSRPKEVAALIEEAASQAR